MNETEIENLAEKAIKDDKLFSELLEKILSKKDEIRYPSFKVLLLISQDHPEVLYPKWDFFADLINSDNAYRRLIAVQLISNLTKVDTEQKFEKIFDKYYNLLNDSVIVSVHLASNSGKIAKTKPELETEITKKLLGIENIDHKHKELIKSGAIEAFGEYFEESKNQKKILEFVKKQLESSSPKTKKKAKEFLKKLDK